MKYIREMQEHHKRLDLLYEISKKVGTESELSKLLDNIIEMTQQGLKATASSVFLTDRETGELSFEVVKGEVANEITEMKVKLKSGIATWVANNNKPLIVNDVTTDRRFNKDLDENTGFVTKSILCSPLVVGRRTIGSLEVLNKKDGSKFNDDDLEVLTSLASIAALAIDNARARQSALDAYMHTIKMLSKVVDAKDPYTHGHSLRVAEYAFQAGVSLSLPQEQLQTVEYSGILHDIGKIAIEESILRKPGTLTPEEWNIIRGHPSFGADMIPDVPFLRETKKCIRHHHERYDGTGYPDGLKGEDTPIGARLLSVADAFDTMTTYRPYKATVGVDGAIAELQRHRGTQFCPIAVKAFISGLDKRLPECWESSSQSCKTRC